MNFRKLDMLWSHAFRNRAQQQRTESVEPPAQVIKLRYRACDPPLVRIADTASAFWYSSRSDIATAP
jgi:hypothetical protein